MENPPCFSLVSQAFPPKKCDFPSPGLALPVVRHQICSLCLWPRVNICSSQERISLPWWAATSWALWWPMTWNVEEEDLWHHGYLKKYRKYMFAGLADQEIDDIKMGQPTCFQSRLHSSSSKRVYLNVDQILLQLLRSTSTMVTVTFLQFRSKILPQPPFLERHQSGCCTSMLRLGCATIPVGILTISKRIGWSW